ncbi:peptidoglycan recognition protein 1-like [Macrosteles quadrilineatus]|uniref:peptidoglycan recognition protein 1-like n=1 Tax=Macrosteles quadrilineatus TaxID=74068 RepID=UPI0023E24354|nr:peptidoglycan recognition protein 1-like [Macrosteles quadrilineatus]
MDDDSEHNLNLVFRGKWGAAHAKARILLRYPVTYVVYTFTDTPICISEESCAKTMRGLQTKHMDGGEDDINYNFVIGGDGSVFIGRGWEVNPALNPKFEEYWEDCIEIAHIGPSGLPPDTIHEAAKKLFLRGVNRGYLKKDFRCIFDFDKSDEPDPKPKGVELKEREIIYE